MKKLKLFFPVAVTFLLTNSCNNEDVTDTVLLKENSRELIESCSSDLVNGEYLETDDLDTPQKVGVFEKRNKWNKGQTIRIKFLNGDDFLRNKIKSFCIEWMEYANIKFVFVPSNKNADIKISFKFNGDKGSWSYIGKTARGIAQNKPSMNFGWFDHDTSDEKFRKTILHEFGHALGLNHEHRHPKNKINWNKPVVYAHYAKQGWNKAKVDLQVFKRLSSSENNYTTYDKNSIMHYSIPPEFTTDGYSVDRNSELSTMDKEFIKLIYPFK